MLPVGRFGSILRESSDEKLLIEVDAQGVKVKGERSEFNLPGGNPDEFPSVVSFTEEKYHKLPARLFKELIRRTLFATDTESSRYALGGVLLEMEPTRSRRSARTAAGWPRWKAPPKRSMGTPPARP